MKKIEKKVEIKVDERNLIEEKEENIEKIGKILGKEEEEKDEEEKIKKEIEEMKEKEEGKGKGIIIIN